MQKLYIIIVLAILSLSINGIANSSIAINDNEDFDPLADVSVTVEIKAIRFLEAEKTGSNALIMFFRDTGENNRFSSFLDIIKRIFNNKIQGEINSDDTPNFFVKVFINDVEFISDIWSNTKYLYNLDWTATLDVPDNLEFVEIKIQLWDSTAGAFKGSLIYDISGDTGDSEDQYDVEITYSIKTGKWTGDDTYYDPSGYGRLCGCDDGTIYKKDRDSELWFDIYQNDYDGDGIPYWTEVNNYGTNPEIKNSGDPDNDKIPVEWEYKWGYNPFVYEDYENDPDGDSINNFEEYLTSEWYSDPFRKDVFVELDLMGEGPNGEISYFPENSEELITTAFDRQNIVYHQDYGDMGGHEIIPFEENVSRRDLYDIYYNYFLHGDENNWRRGVFHYGVVVYTSESAAGYQYRANAFQISSRGHENIAKNHVSWDRDIVYGSAYMHELGHTFAFWPIPGHSHTADDPWEIGFWINRPYESCMNYGWMYQFVDYSDGSNGGVDINDWGRIDYDAFERNWG